MGTTKRKRKTITKNIPIKRIKPSIYDDSRYTIDKKIVHYKLANYVKKYILTDRHLITLEGDNCRLH